MVHSAGAVSHQSEIRRGSGEASDWIAQLGEQTYLFKSGMKGERKGENEGG